MIGDLFDFKDYFKRIRRQFILNNYYTSKTKDGKSIQASLIDWIFLTIIIFTFFLITIYNSTKKVVLSIILTMVIVGIYLIFLIVWKRKNRLVKIKEINEDLASKQVLKEITKYGNRDFLTYVKELIEKYYDIEIFQNTGHINFFGEINGELYGIKCVKSSMEDRVGLKELRHFMDEVENYNLEYGIIVTNSYFSEEVRKEVDYLLIDFDGIKKMLKAIGTYPNKEEIEELIINRHRSRREKIKKSLSFYKKDKIYKFILLGFIFYIISPFVSYPLYYRLMAFICMGFGIIIAIYNLVGFLQQRRIDI